MASSRSTGKVPLSQDPAEMLARISQAGIPFREEPKEEVVVEEGRLHPAAVMTLTIVALVAGWWLLIRKKRPHSRVPLAPGSIPVLGHNTGYRVMNPTFFLEDLQERVGKGVFRIALAGRHLLLIGTDDKAREQVLNASESVLSSRHADTAFAYVLGEKACFQGMDIHTRIVLKHTGTPDKLQTIRTERIQPAILQAMQQETKTTTTTTTLSSETTNNRLRVDDLFAFSRRIVLRVMIRVFFGSIVLDQMTQEEQSNLLNEIMEFQNRLEDATARATVLPKWLAVPLVLAPVKRMRLQLQDRFEHLFRHAFTKQDKDDKDMLGPWLATMHQQERLPVEAAELAPSFLLQAHNNVAIGAAQSFCFLYEFEKELYEQAKKGPGVDLSGCVMETMRLTAHAIGGLRTVMQPFDLALADGKTVYPIQKGEYLAVSHCLVNQRGKDGYRFRADRKEHHSITFSQGTHKCPGETTALAVMEELLSLWLRRDMTPTQTTFPTMSFARATLAQRNGNVPVTISKQ